MKLRQFRTPAGLRDMDRIDHQREAWSQTLSHKFEVAIRLVERPGASGLTFPDGTPLPSLPLGSCQLYNPTGRKAAESADETVREVFWTALPQRLVLTVGRTRAWQAAEELKAWNEIGETADGMPFNLPYRNQVEYCEWRVTREVVDGVVRIRKVTFTCETIEYWWSLAQGYPTRDYDAPPPGERAPAKGDLNTVLRLYRTLVGPEVELADLVFPCDVYTATVDPRGRRRRKKLYSAGEYNPWNRWNTANGLVHMSAPVNALTALVSQCAFATIGRRANGIEVRDPSRLMGQGGPMFGGGGINDFADNAIVGVVGSLARAGAMITICDPIAVVIKGINTNNWRLPKKAPPGATPERYWRIIRGRPGAVLRAELEVPEEDGFCVSDIEIAGVPIRFGSQIAECLTVGFDVCAMRFGSVRREPVDDSGQPVRLVTGPLELRANQLKLAPDLRWEPAFPAEPSRTLKPVGKFEEPLLDDREIQGNVLAGFNKDHSWIIGLSIVDVARAKKWLRNQVGSLSTLAEVATYKHTYRAHLRNEQSHPGTAAWFNISFSFAAIQKLSPRDAVEFESLAYKSGIRRRATVERATEPDILVMLGADDAADLPKVLGSETAIVANAREWGLELVFLRVGENRDGREHFGFKDGISQPGVRGHLSTPGNPLLTPRELDLSHHETDARYRDIHEPEYSRPGQPLVWPGEFVHGYARQSPRHPREPLPPAPCAPGWTRNGSFLTYVQFRQDVEAFQQTVAEQAHKLGLSADHVAALMVGRWPSGSPLVEYPDADGGLPSNHFLFADTAGRVALADGTVADSVAADPRGYKCPFFAHVRKMNPRDETHEGGTLPATLKRRLLRRGIPYGPPYAGPGDHRDRGILFLCYQASIEDQFEFLFHNWLNDPQRPAGPGGVDLFVGNHNGEARRGTSCRFGSLEIGRRFVEAIDGGYFFAPSISAVAMLAG
jgi:Dyp-type peroxidase family